MVDKVEKFRYERPAPAPEKVLVTLGRIHGTYASVQVIPAGTQGRLHMHRGTDGFWYVLTGVARFVDDGGGVHAELVAGEGVIVPRGTRYRLDNPGDDPLEILHVSSTAAGFDVTTDFVGID